MLILRPHEPLVLLPVPKFQWRARSAAQVKDQFGNEDQTRFRLRLRLNDGHVKWVGWFDDRDEFDSYLWAVVQQYEHGWEIPPALRNHIVEDYGDPTFYPGLQYDFATVTFLTTTTGSNQTYTSPVDWNNSNNTVDGVGAGASGAAAGATATWGACTGGSGPGFSRITNFSFATPGTTTATYQLGTGGAAVGSSSVNAAGNNGGDTWFNGASGAVATLWSKGGTGGTGGASSATGPAGATAGTGATLARAGGKAGNCTTTTAAAASGGGGAAGPTAAGSAAANATNTRGNGANGDGGSGGSGGAGSGVSAGDGTNGSAGTIYDATHGIGGSGGAGSRNTTCFAGSGGNYGGSGGGTLIPSGGSGTCTSGAGAQGMIVVTYTPFVAKGFPFANLNPMSVMLAR